MNILSLMLCFVAGVQLWRQYIFRMKMSLEYNMCVKTFAEPKVWITRAQDIRNIFWTNSSTIKHAIEFQEISLKRNNCKIY